MEMSVEDLDNDIRYITLTGSLDLTGIPDIEVKMAALSGHHKNIVIDMAGVDYIASIGIGMLVKDAQAVTHHGGHFVICRPREMVEEVLRNMVIDKLIPIYPTKDEAIAAVAG